jgi:hypothetical protein
MAAHRPKARQAIAFDPALAREAKAIVALAFRNGPIEDLHAGVPCPTCAQDDRYSRLSNAELKVVMKNAVNHVYRLLWQRTHDHQAYEANVALGQRFSTRWDDPET